MWADRLETPEYFGWTGRSFEIVCLQHVRNIKRALEIGGVRTMEYAWRGKTSDGRSAQIDLLVDRNDGIMDICEMKCTQAPYALTEAEWNRIVIRRQALKDSLSSDRTLHVVMVTSLPMIRNVWSREVMGFVSADALLLPTP